MILGIYPFKKYTEELTNLTGKTCWLGRKLRKDWVIKSIKLKITVTVSNPFLKTLKHIQQLSFITPMEKFYWFEVEKLWWGGAGDNTVGSAPALHTTNTDLIPGTKQGPLSPPQSQE